MAELKVESSPSKEFFINMITKDVSVESCILDLIDNSIDSYKRNREYIKRGIIDIGFNKDEDCFYINDNCGGMSKEIAETKAFKFGNHVERFSKALGMYGIGMKRSIFKIGKDFSVYSKTDNDSFRVFMNIDKWVGIDDWKFYIEDINNNFENGVHIKITQLNPSLQYYFSMKKNISDLITSIRNSYKSLLSNDIEIRINGQRISYEPENMFESDLLKIKTYIKTYNLQKVNIKVVAGMGDPSPKDAGWCIVANGRAIIEKDHTSLTGWESDYNAEDDGSIEEKFLNKSIPAYHNDFARFRGYVFLESENANDLPLNTTKDGIDKQHPIYKFIFNEMCKALRIILPELRLFQETVRECNRELKQSPVSCLKPIKVSSLESIDNQDFSMDISEYKPIDTIKTVPVYVEAKKLTRLKSFFEVSTNKQLGDELLRFVTERIDIDE